MSNRDQTVYDLERCICHVPDACRDCSKHNAEGLQTLTCMESLMKDALELLKPVEPIPDQGAVFVAYHCGNCKTYFYLRQQKYCAICGRAVKWDG